MFLAVRTFDHETAPPSLFGVPGRVLRDVSRWSPKAPEMRLLFRSRTLQPQDLVSAFQEIATPEGYLPPALRLYRVEYERFLQDMQRIRYFDVWLWLPDGYLSEEAVAGVLATHGLHAELLEGALPRPFERYIDRFTHLEIEGGGVAALLQWKADQTGNLITPTCLHGLAGLDFEVWGVLHMRTWRHTETTSLLRNKKAEALFGPRTLESEEDAVMVAETIAIVKQDLARGEAFHTATLYILVTAGDRRELQERIELVRAAVSYDLKEVRGAGDLVHRLFSNAPLLLPKDQGVLLTTSGASLLLASALGYRQRRFAHGVMLGVGRNQAPFIWNIFDDRAPSYNTVVLGQTGAGKTFAILLTMLRHLLLGVRLIIVDPQGNIDLDWLGEEVAQRTVLTEDTQVNVLERVHNHPGRQVDFAAAMLHLLGLPDDPISHGLLLQALYRLYHRMDAPLLGDLYDELREGYAATEWRREAEQLLLALEPFVHGGYAAWFSRPSNVDFSLRTPANVYDLSRLPSQEVGGIRAAMLAVLVANIHLGVRLARARGDRVPILFFIDEIGVLSRDRVIASNTSYEFKTARARGVGMIVADQDLHSLLGPADPGTGLHHGEAMLANAANVLIFRQRDSEVAKIRQTFPAIPGPWVESLPLFRTGTCIVQTPDDLDIVTVLPTDLERVVLSSRLQDRELARRIREHLAALASGGEA